MKQFEFADKRVWGEERLLAHATHMQEINGITHVEPRKSEVDRELLHIAFECGQRAVEAAFANRPVQAIEAAN